MPIIRSLDEGCSHIVEVLRALLQCVALFHSVTPLVSSRVLMLSHSAVHPSVTAMRQHCGMLLTLRATMDKNAPSTHTEVPSINFNLKVSVVPNALFMCNVFEVEK